MKQIQVYQLERKDKVIKTLYTTGGEYLNKWLKKIQPGDKILIKEIKDIKDDN